MADVPEGQVPRDEAFWRTYHAVNAEDQQRLARYRCRRDGHVILYRHDWAGCENCGMSLDEVMREAGAVQRGNQWILEPPCP